MPLGMEVGLGPSDLVLDGDPAPHPQKWNGVPHLWAHVYCGQTAGWMKMALGMEVGLCPGHIVLDGTQLPQQFSVHVYCGKTAGWIKMPLGTEVGLTPGDIVLDGDPALSPKRSTTPNIRPMSIVAKRLYVSGYRLVRRLASA